MGDVLDDKGQKSDKLSQPHGGTGFDYPGVVRKGAGRPPKSASPFIIEDSGCWTWQRAINHRGYGLLWNGEKMMAAHRHFYEQAKGEIPAGLHLDHLCRNRACVNPEHLEAVTPTENSRRGLVAKISMADAREIRSAHESGKPYDQIGRQFGISGKEVSRICKGERWKELPESLPLPSTPERTTK